LNSDTHLIGFVLLHFHNLTDGLPDIEDLAELPELALLELREIKHVVDFKSQELGGAVVDAVAMF